MEQHDNRLANWITAILADDAHELIRGRIIHYRRDAFVHPNSDGRVSVLLQLWHNQITVHVPREQIQPLPPEMVARVNYVFRPEQEAAFQTLYNQGMAAYELMKRLQEKSRRAANGFVIHPWDRPSKTKYLENLLLHNPHMKEKNQKDVLSLWDGTLKAMTKLAKLEAEWAS